MAYAYQVFGLRTSFVTGWFLAFVWISATSFEAISAGWIAGILFPPLRGSVMYAVHGTPVLSGTIVIALAGTVFLTILNYRGMKSSGRFQDVFTWTKIAISVLLVAAGIVWGRASNLEPLVAPGALGSNKLAGILAVFVTAPFWLAGFNTIAQVIEEKKPETSYQKVAASLLLSIAAACAFYALLILSASMALPWRQITTFEFPALGAFAAALHSELGAKVVLLSGLLGLLATWNAVFVAGSRIVFALGRARMIRPEFGHVHPLYGSPGYSVVFVGVISGLGILFGRGLLSPTVNMDSSCFVLLYFLVALALIRLRMIEPDRVRPYRLPGGYGTAIVAAVATLCMFAESLYIPFDVSGHKIPLEWVLFLAWGALGSLFWVLSRSTRDKLSESERHRLVLGSEEVAILARSEIDRERDLL